MMASSTSLENRVCSIFNSLGWLALSGGIVVETIHYLKVRGIPDNIQPSLIISAGLALSYLTYKSFQKGAQQMMGYDLLGNDD